MRTERSVIAAEPLSRQLSESAYVLDLREPDPAGQDQGERRRFGWREEHGQEGPQPCVLLVSRAADQEAALLETLLRKISIPCARLDAEAVSGSGLVVDLAGRQLRLGGRWIRPTVSWVRHFSARALADHRGAAQELFLRDSWQALAAQLGVISGTAISAAPGLLDQLAVAARHGIRIPRTIVVAGPGEVGDLLPAGRRIVKALHQHFVEASPGLLTGVFPQVLENGAVAGAGELPAPPVVLQEYLEHDVELRSYYISGEILAFEVSKESPADPWTGPERVEVRQAEPPAAVIAATRQLASAMSLAYGAFDFLMTDGTPAFLEADPAGDWRWIEKRIKQAPVTTAVARMLRDLHLQAAGRAGATGPPIELTTFLSGASTQKREGTG